MVGGAQNANRLQGRYITPTAPVDTDVLVWDATNNYWKPGTAGTSYCGPAPVVDSSGGTAPTAAQLKCGAIVSNYGQAAANVNVTLPAIAAAMSFRVDINTTQAANYFRVTSAEGANMSVDDIVTGKNYVQFSTPTARDGFTCMSFRTGASSWSWLCYGRKGTLTTN